MLHLHDDKQNSCFPFISILANRSLKHKHLHDTKRIFFKCFIFIYLCVWIYFFSISLRLQALKRQDGGEPGQASRHGSKNKGNNITHTTILDIIHDTMMRTASGCFTYPRKSLITTISTPRNTDAGSNQSRLPSFTLQQHLSCSLRCSPQQTNWLCLKYLLVPYGSALCRVWNNGWCALSSALYIKQ